MKPLRAVKRRCICGHINQQHGLYNDGARNKEGSRFYCTRDNCSRWNICNIRPSQDNGGYEGMSNPDYPEGVKESDIDNVGQSMDREQTECAECGEALQMLLRCPYCTDMGKELRKGNEIKLCLENHHLEIAKLRGLLKKVLDWRALDGDGISDPLRITIKKYLEKKTI